MPYPPAAYGLKGLPGPPGRFIHHRASCRSYATRLKRMAPVSKTLVLLPKGGTYLGTRRNTIQLARCKMSKAEYSTAHCRPSPAGDSALSPGLKAGACAPSRKCSDSRARGGDAMADGANSGLAQARALVQNLRDVGEVGRPPDLG